MKHDEEGHPLREQWICESDLYSLPGSRVLVIRWESYDQPSLYVGSVLTMTDTSLTVTNVTWFDNEERPDETVDWEDVSVYRLHDCDCR